MTLVVRVQIPLVTPNKFFAVIAPMVEQWTENSCVAGSSPAYGTKFCKCQQEKDSLGRFFEGQPSAKIGRVRVP